MRLRAALLLGCFGATLAACDSEAHVVTVRVDHYQEPCGGESPGFCLRILESSDPTLVGTDRISGFEHAWGIVSDLEVLVTTPVDGPPTYDLVAVLDERAVDPNVRFRMELGPEFVARVDPFGFALVSDKSVLCDHADPCEVVSTAMSEALDFEVELGYPRSRGGAFVAFEARLLD
jgi:hypothetical protein